MSFVGVVALLVERPLLAVPVSQTETSPTATRSISDLSDSRSVSGQYDDIVEPSIWQPEGKSHEVEVGDRQLERKSPEVEGGDRQLQGKSPQVEVDGGQPEEKLPQIEDDNSRLEKSLELNWIVSPSNI